MHVFFILQLKEIKMSRKPISAKKIGIYFSDSSALSRWGYNMGAIRSDNKCAVQFYRPDGKLLTSQVHFDKSPTWKDMLQ